MFTHKAKAVLREGRGLAADTVKCHRLPRHSQLRVRVDRLGQCCCCYKDFLFQSIAWSVVWSLGQREMWPTIRVRNRALAALRVAVLYGSLRRGALF